MLLYILLIAAGALILPEQGHSAYTVQQGKLLNTKEIATMSVQEHFSAATDALEQKDWDELVAQAWIVYKNFPSTPFAQEALYYLGIGYFHLGELEKANKELGNYLKRQTPLHFEEAIQCKFAIAEQYKSGKKKPLLGWRALPRWLPAREDAVAIYDEVISALPHHDLGAQALYGKAKLLFRDEDYKASVETYQAIIRRFPKHPLTPESYVGIAEVYAHQAKTQYPDPDFLDLAEINLRKFCQDFPKEGRTAIAEELFDEMQEVYANSFYEIGSFYERTKKHAAAAIYFQQVMDRYPDTQVASLSERRLVALKEKGVSLPHELVPSQEIADCGCTPGKPSDQPPSGKQLPKSKTEQKRTIPSPNQPAMPEVEDKRTLPSDEPQTPEVRNPGASLKQKNEKQNMLVEVDKPLPDIVEPPPNPAPKRRPAEEPIEEE